MTRRLPVRVLGPVALGLLLLTTLATPAFAWHVKADAGTNCIPGTSKAVVNYTILPDYPEEKEPENPEDLWKGTVRLWYEFAGETIDLPGGELSGKLSEPLTGTFEVDTTKDDSVTIRGEVDWDDELTKERNHKFQIARGLPRGCKPKDTTTTSSSTTTTIVETTTTAGETTTTAAETTTTAGETTTTAGEATTTTAAAAPTTQGGGPQLPFTGANTIPMLLIGALLLVAGFGVLKATRARSSRSAQ